MVWWSLVGHLLRSMMFRVASTARSSLILSFLMRSILVTPLIMRSVLISAAWTLDAVLVVSDQFSEPYSRIGLRIVVNMSTLVGVGTCLSFNSGKSADTFALYFAILLSISISCLFSSFVLTPRYEKLSTCFSRTSPMFTCISILSLPTCITLPVQCHLQSVQCISYDNHIIGINKCFFLASADISKTVIHIKDKEERRENTSLPYTRLHLEYFGAHVVVLNLTCAFCVQASDHSR